jgi:hypothetical protein
MTFECLRGSAELSKTDRRIVETFATFLRETPKGLLDDFARTRHYFDDPADFNAWRMRWLPYLAGLADGPTDASEYVRHLPKLRVWWQEWSAARSARSHGRGHGHGSSTA